MQLGLPVGKHIVLSYTDNEGKQVSRQYTPVSSKNQGGFFDLIIKIYPNGKMGQYLANLPLQTPVLVKGPQGMIQYFGGGRFVIKRKYKDAPKLLEKTHSIKKIGMIAGGSGITPMLQIIRSIVGNSNDSIEMSLIYGNVTEEDILMRSELDQYASQVANFKLVYTLDKPSDTWKGDQGFVSADMIRSHLPGPAHDTLVLLCGPPGMLNAMQQNLEKLNYEEDHYFKY